MPCDPEEEEEEEEEEESRHWTQHLLFTRIQE
jgi:hypothetical protein